MLQFPNGCGQRVKLLILCCLEALDVLFLVASGCLRFFPLIKAG